METRHLLYYYLSKRVFLMIDEWLFYVVLYKLFTSRYYKVWVLVLLYGSGCIYTSYVNISRIERLITNIDQEMYAIEPGARLLSFLLDDENCSGQNERT